MAHVVRREAEAVADAPNRLAKHLDAGLEPATCGGRAAGLGAR
jgi:hypothetical protein